MKAFEINYDDVVYGFWDYELAVKCKEQLKSKYGADVEIKEYEVN